MVTYKYRIHKTDYTSNDWNKISFSARDIHVVDGRRYQNTIKTKRGNKIVNKR